MPSYTISPTGTINADGDHLVVPRSDPNTSGRFNVRASGVFGGLSITLGFMDTETNSIFTPYTDGGPFTEAFSLQADGGKFSNMAVQLTGVAGADVVLDLSALN